MKVLFTGSFFPFHMGHEYVYNTACKCFGKENVWLGVGANKDKPNRDVEAIKFSLVPITKNVITYTGLTADVVKQEGFDILVRGIRPGKSLEQEEEMLYWNRKLAGVETILIPTPPRLNQISSSAIRELDYHGVSVLDCMNFDVYNRWKAGSPSTTIYFGKTCSGKSSFLKNVGCLDADKKIWDFVALPFEEIELLKAKMKVAFYEKNHLEYYNLISKIGNNVQWRTFLSFHRIDAAVIGAYWEYIPLHLRANIKLIKIETSESNRQTFAKKRLINPEQFLECADYFYEDPPYWDETIIIKDIE